MERTYFGMENVRLVMEIEDEVDTETENTPQNPPNNIFR